DIDAERVLHGEEIIIGPRVHESYAAIGGHVRGVELEHQTGELGDDGRQRIAALVRGDEVAAHGRGRIGGRRSPKGKTLRSRFSDMLRPDAKSYGFGSAGVRLPMLS